MKQILGICVVLGMALSAVAIAGDSRTGLGTNRVLASEDLLAGNKLLSGAQHENILGAARISQFIASPMELEERLGISRYRADAIFIGPEGKENVIDFFATSDPGGTRIICIGAKCACYGDEDCNKMFTTICADPATNGSCVGQICTCTP